MTDKEFLKHFEKAAKKFTWRLVKDADGDYLIRGRDKGNLKSRKCFCPITATFYAMTGVVYDVDDFAVPAGALKLQTPSSTDDPAGICISWSSDVRLSRLDVPKEKALRKQLLKIIGLKEPND